METPVFFVGIFLVVLKWLLWPVFWWKSRQKTIALPAINEPLLLLSAAQLAENIRKKVFSSEEVVAAYIQRVKDVNPMLNAVVEERFVAAVEDAKAVDKYISESILSEEELKQCKPLLGVPVTIKESCRLAGLSHCVGTLTRLNVKAKSDGEAVRRLKSAGAIPLLVSNTPELGLSWECNNLVTGATCNPHNVNYSSGGSSGGEGALLSAAASVIGLGSDTAGSIRIPAMFNGVFGHKPTPGLIPIEGHYPFSPDKKFSEYLVVGPLARFAEDLKIMMTVLTGNISTYNGLGEKVDLSKLTVYFMEEVPGYPVVVNPVQQEIKNAINEAVEYLKEVHHSNISNFKFEGLDSSLEISVTLFLALNDMPNILEDTKNSEITPNLYIEFIKSLFGKSMFFQDTLIYYMLQRTNILVPKEKRSRYVNASKVLKETFLNKLGTSGVFLYPTFPTSAFLHKESALKVFGVLYAMIFNILGFPSTHVPLGLDENGMPIGLQVVAAPNQDRLCLDVAVALEKRFGGWLQPRSV